MIRRAGTLGPLLALLVSTLLGGCGQAAAPSASAGHNCHTSPPDVVDLASITLGGGGASVSTAERDAENRYLYAHWGVAAEGMLGNGGYYYMGFTDDAQTHLAELRRAVPDPGHVRAYCAPYSQASLGSTMDRLQHDLSTLHAEGIDLSGWDEDQITGRVDVTVVHLTSDIAQRIRQRYGAIIGTIGEGVGVAD